MLEKKYLKSRSRCQVTFSLPLEAAAFAQKVQVLGDFNGWDQRQGTMERTEEGFQATLELEADRRYEFRYLIDGEIWENDWNADAYVPSPFGVDNSVVVIGPAQTLS